jgi:DNA topoisomerase-1
VEGDAVVLHFIGKKGVENKIPIYDKELSKELIERAKQAGEDGKIFKTNNSALLDYAHTLDGGGFKTKDFRTLLGTRTAMELISKVKKPNNEKEYKKAVMDIANQVSQKLGNTPSVALKSYIAPEVFSTWKL